MENSRKGTENSSGTISTNHKSLSSFDAAVSSTRKLTSHFSVLSLNGTMSCWPEPVATTPLMVPAMSTPACET